LFLPWFRARRIASQKVNGTIAVFKGEPRFEAFVEPHVSLGFAMWKSGSTARIPSLKAVDLAQATISKDQCALRVENGLDAYVFHSALPSFA